MHQQYARDGVACVSVSVDELDNRQPALKFLKSQQAAFPNYLLDEPTEKWQDKWSIVGPPAVLVYSRDGKLVRKFDNGDEAFSYADVERLVKKLLRGE